MHTSDFKTFLDRKVEWTGFWFKKERMQNTGNFNHFYIARFEAYLKYVILNAVL